jgi:hypothetical protein
VSIPQHQLIPDAGHYIQFDRPDLVTVAVLSVVNSVRDRRKGEPFEGGDGATVVTLR